MPAFMKLEGIDGSATDEGHKGWINIQSLSAAVNRSIAPGRDTARSRGETTLADIVVVRPLDKSSVPLQQRCAEGKTINSVEIHLCTNANGKTEPYLKYKLNDVIIASYSFHGVDTGDPQPTEEITLNFISVEWTYVILCPQKNTPLGQVPGSYNPSKGSA